MADAIHDRPARLEPLEAKGKRPAYPRWTCGSDLHYDGLVTIWSITVTRMSNLDGSKYHEAV